jgi:Raf kinase inhibitor-like YbhB/YbcL family protein
MSIIESGGRALFAISALSLVHCSDAATPAPDSVAGSASGAATGGAPASASGGGGAITAGNTNTSGAATGGTPSSAGTGGSSNQAGSSAGIGGAGGGGAGGAAQAGSGDGGNGAFAVTSSEHTEGAMLADALTCAGEGRSPALSWTAGPPGTKSYALTFFDQDLVDMNSPNGYHWVLWDIPASVLALPADLPSGATLTEPVIAKQISPQNPFDQLPANTFFGPCPNAIGNTNDTHHYTFTLYALGVETLTGTLSSVKNVDTAIQAATPLATAKLTGLSNAKPD